jgi:RimJ/RimL family protein N-acetyltransferase
MSAGVERGDRGGSADGARLYVIRADETHIPFIMAAERGAGYEDLVGRWDEAQHRAAFADGRYAYFVLTRGHEPLGFALLRDFGSPERVTFIKRVAVAQPGQGHGKALLTGVARVVFEETVAWRLWLGLFPDNLRARRTYEAVGFRAEGIARGSAFFRGANRDELIMGMVRPDWERANGEWRIG